jgi:hypothetical protein
MANESRKRVLDYATIQSPRSALILTIVLMVLLLAWAISSIVEFVHQLNAPPIIIPKIVALDRYDQAVKKALELWKHDPNAGRSALAKVVHDARASDLLPGRGYSQGEIALLDMYLEAPEGAVDPKTTQDYLDYIRTSYPGFHLDNYIASGIRVWAPPTTRPGAKRGADRPVQ